MSEYERFSVSQRMQEAKRLRNTFP